MMVNVAVSIKCRLQTGYKMQTRYKMQTADCRLGTKCRLRPKPPLRQISGYILNFQLTLVSRHHISEIISHEIDLSLTHFSTVCFLYLDSVAFIS